MHKLFFFFCVLLVISTALSQEEKSLVVQADEALRENKLDVALNLYTKALKESPNDFSVYYKRATVYLGQRDKSEEALSDLERALALKPDFFQGIYRKGKTLLQFGRYQEAKKDFEEALRLKPGYSLAEESLRTLNKALELEATAKKHFEQSDYLAAQQIYTELISISPDHKQHRLHRANCALHTGETSLVLEDTKQVLKKDATNSNAYLYRGQVLILVGDVESASKMFGQGLRFDPDHKELKDNFKKSNNFVKYTKRVEENKRSEKWDEVVTDLIEAIKLYSTLHELTLPLEHTLCEAFFKAGNLDKALETCNSVIERDENNVDSLVWRAETRLKKGDFDGAVADYNKARSLQPNNRRILEGLQEAQLQQKKSKQKDLYKILGVPKDATTSQIKKAFHKHALESHPDKADSASKEEAEAKYREITEAYEILSDPEKKQKYDNGEDLQATPQSHGHHHGFPFGAGGPFNFHFEFRH